MARSIRTRKAQRLEEIEPLPTGVSGQQSGRKPKKVLAEVADLLFVPGQPRYRRVLQRRPEGRITAFAERPEAWDLLWKLTVAAPKRPSAVCDRRILAMDRRQWTGPNGLTNG